MFSIDGIVSGFETGTIIESLLGFQETQIETFNSRKAEITTQQSAFQGIEAQLLTLGSSLGRLNRTSGSVFDVQNASSSNEDIITAAASSGASNGVYSLTVNSLATAHQIGSQGFASSTETIASGDYTLQVGNRAASTITIGPGNNTLKGFADAINEQSDDVNAGIIYDQGTDAYRVLLTSKHTGAENEISISSDATTGSVPSFLGDPIQPATDALIALGSGAGAINVSYASNQVEELIENVTLNLESANPGETVTIAIESDTEPAKEAIGSFVENFNSIMEFIDNQTQFNAETNQASPLLGNRSVSKIQNTLRQFAIDVVPGLPSGSNRLASIGIDIDSSGRLTLDEGKLDKALNGQLEGVEPGDIRKLFGLNGSSTNTGVEFLTGSTRTLGSETPYEVDITQAAEQASVEGTIGVGTLTTISSANKEFQISVDGQASETLTLAEGIYTREELAAQLQSVINASTELGARDVEVSVNGSKLEITSLSYGSSSEISDITGTAGGSLGFFGIESDTGQDVAGSFIVDGVTEIAKGSGRVLIGDSDNENTADLQVKVTLTAGEIVSGVEAELGVTRGVSGRLDQYLNEVLDTENGALKTINEDFEARIQSIDDSISRVEAITEAKRDFLIAEFTALESIISDLQTTGNFLSAQLSSINSSNSK